MKLTLLIKNETGETLVTHGMELTEKFKLKYMPDGKSIKEIIKRKVKGEKPFTKEEFTL